jgi:hypothetical protein
VIANPGTHTGFGAAQAAVANLVTILWYLVSLVKKTMGFLMVSELLLKPYSLYCPRRGGPGLRDRYGSGSQSQALAEVRLSWSR